MKTNNITVVLTTNPVIHWSPSTKLVEYTVEHLSEFHQSPWVICCDVENKNHEYYQALSQPECLSVLPNKQLIHNAPGKSGLKWSFINSAEYIQTDYVLFMEHDWEFLVEINWEDVVQTMDKNDFIKKISFNKRANQQVVHHSIPFQPTDEAANKALNVSQEFIYPLKSSSDKPHLGKPRGQLPGNDTYFEIDPRLAESPVPLIKALRWANNPYIARTEKYKEWVNIINNGGDGKNCKGVEEVLIHRFRTQCYTTSWKQTHADWGVYMYGGMNEPAAVKHVNGKARHW